MSTSLLPVAGYGAASTIERISNSLPEPYNGIFLGATAALMALSTVAISYELAVLNRDASRESQLVEKALD